MPVNSIKIKINGTEYAIKSEEAEKHIRRVAGYVDEKMKEISKDVPIKTQHKIAVLAALNIADELYKEKEKAIESRDKDAVRLVNLIDDRLKAIENKYGD